MENVLLLSTLLKLGFAGVAICLVVFVLKALDKMLGVKFAEDVWTEIDNGNAAVAQYMGLRFFACCYLVGQLLGG